MFNEKLYLEQNPDVAQALQKNMLHSAFYHWLTNGITEQRRFSVVGDPGTEIDHS
ncbi:hypothetical protein DVDV_2864 [Desulfovibrio sp. DV]|nr:hypothetical protein DVDV_2864 [Desulfovibrio sp. DV]